MKVYESEEASSAHSSGDRGARGYPMASNSAIPTRGALVVGQLAEGRLDAGATLDRAYEPTRKEVGQ